jgi:hypothetical protein
MLKLNQILLTSDFDLLLYLSQQLSEFDSESPQQHHIWQWITYWKSWNFDMWSNTIPLNIDKQNPYTQILQNMPL